MPVDVLHVVPAFFPTRGGIEVLVENLTQQLNEASGFLHAVLAPRVDGERPDTFSTGSTPVYSVDAPHPDRIRRHHEGLEQLPQEHAEFARILLKTRQHISFTQPRLIHLHGLSLVGNAASAIATSMGIPVVMHIHGSVGGALSPNMRDQLHSSVRVIAVSRAVQQSIEAETGRTSGVHVVPNGLPDTKNEVRQRHTQPTERSVTLIGRLEPAKGFDHALRDLASLADHWPQLTINVVGVGQEEQSLRAIARSHGLPDSVVFHGRLEHREAMELLARTTCVVIPSVAYEGFSLVALESAFLERPVVASNVGGLPETVLNGVTGTIVNPLVEGEIATAVHAYLTDQLLAAKHGAAARQRALREFTLERIAKEITQIHKDALT